MLELLYDINGIRYKMLGVHSVRYNIHTECEGSHGILLRYMTYGVRAKEIGLMDTGSLILDSDGDENTPRVIITADGVFCCTPNRERVAVRCSN